jgi:hypothetical protein
MIFGTQALPKKYGRYFIIVLSIKIADGCLQASCYERPFTKFALLALKPGGMIYVF